MSLEKDSPHLLLPVRHFESSPGIRKHCGIIDGGNTAFSCWNQELWDDLYVGVIAWLVPRQAMASIWALVRAGPQHIFM